MREYKYKCRHKNGNWDELRIKVKPWEAKDLLPENARSGDVKYTAFIAPEENLGLKMITPENNPAHSYGLTEEEAKYNAEGYLRQIGYAKVEPVA